MVSRLLNIGWQSIIDTLNTMMLVLNWEELCYLGVKAIKKDFVFPILLAIPIIKGLITNKFA